MVESGRPSWSFSGTINREYSRRKSKELGYESRQNPLPSSAAQAPVRLTTIGSVPPPCQLSDKPNIGWVAHRGTGETRGERGLDSAESETRIHGCRRGGGGEKRWLSTRANPAQGCGYKYECKMWQSVKRVSPNVLVREFCYFCVLNGVHLRMRVQLFPLAYSQQLMPS